MTDIDQIKITDEMSALERHVAEWVNERAQDYENGALGVLEDIQHGGCASGYVNTLIYTADCIDFFNQFADEIEDLCEDWQDETGEHPLSYKKHGGMREFLAWFAFEETAHRFLSEMERENQ